MKYTYSEEVKERLIAYHYYSWFEDFLDDIFKNTEFKEIVVEDFDSKRIYLKIDNEEYDIRTWNFNCISKDDKGIPNSELVEWTLFKIVSDGDGGGHGEEVSNGETIIKWVNE